MRKRRLDFSVGELDERRVALALQLLHALERPRPRELLRKSLQAAAAGRIVL